MHAPPPAEPFVQPAASRVKVTRNRRGTEIVFPAARNPGVAKGLLAPVRERRLAASDVAEVITRIGMQAGETPYYDLVLVRKDGRRVPAGRAIRDKPEAEWLADTLREALKR